MSDFNKRVYEEDLLPGEFVIYREGEVVEFEDEGDKLSPRLIPVKHHGKPHWKPGTRGKQAAQQKGGKFRKGWEAYRDANLRTSRLDTSVGHYFVAEIDKSREGGAFGEYAWSRSEGVGIQNQAEVYEQIQKQVAFLDDLSSDELLDFTQQYLKNGNMEPDEVDMMVSRLDAKSSEALFKSQLALASKYKDAHAYGRQKATENLGYNTRDVKYGTPEYKKAKAEQEKYSIPQLDANFAGPGQARIAVQALCNFAPTAAQRASFLDKAVPVFANQNDPPMSAEEFQQKGTYWFSAHLLKDLPGNKETVVSQWVSNSDKPHNSWTHAAIAAEFSGKNSVIGYWNVESLGKLYRDPSPEYRQAVRSIYDDTQRYFSNARRKVPSQYYRGVTRGVSVRSNVESWSSSRSVAERFNGHDVWEIAGVPRSAIFMSYKSQHGLWPPEKELLGRKEYTLLPALMEEG